MALVIDPEGRKTTETECPDCGEPAQWAWGFIHDDGDADALTREWT